MIGFPVLVMAISWRFLCCGLRKDVGRRDCVRRRLVGAARAQNDGESMAAQKDDLEIGQ